MKIIGIDPGLNFTGFGIIDYNKGALEYLFADVITTSVKDSIEIRLAKIFSSLDLILKEYKVENCALENVFVNSNNESSLKLGSARGAAIVAVGVNLIPMFEYATNFVKKAVTGKGHASKEQVKYMVKMLLPKCKITKYDVSDALAVAIAHGSMVEYNNKIAKY
jgi:crossover junction endodeoxyribonuclease RuvC